MTSSSRLAVALSLALAAAVLSPQRVQAQPAAPSPTAQELETARALYKEGKELRARGDLAGALEKLQAAHALGNTPVTGIELARTYVMVARIVEAREVCLYIARLPVASDETEKSVAARSEAAQLAEELKPRIPTLRVTIAGLPPGQTARLAIDGAEVPDAAIGEPQKVDPGMHAVAVRVGDGAAAREILGQAAVAEGQAGEVTLSVPPLAARLGPKPAPEPSRPGHSGAWAVQLGFGTAIAGGAVGILAGAVAWSKKGSLSRGCPDGACVDGSSGSRDLSTAHTAATVSTVAFVVGGAGAVMGLIGLVTTGRETARRDAPNLSPWIGLGLAGLRGRF